MTSPTQLSAADVIAQRLYAAGVRNAFGIPGGEVLAIMAALAKAGIRFTLTKHENAAGFMAEGTWHAGQGPGVLLATLGPGVANAINVVANALQDRVPLIIISGCVDAQTSHHFTHQVFDQSALLKPITKASFTVADGAVDIIIDKALAVALDDPPGPVHLDVPISVADSPQAPLTRPLRAPVNRGVAHGQELAKARKWLHSAKNPLLIAGVETLNQHAENQVARFVLDWQIPLITTYKAKGIVAENHPLCLGGAGLSPKADQLLLPLLGKSDLIILAGYDPIEMRIGWSNPWANGLRVLDFSSLPNTHYMHQASGNFVGDIGAGIEALGAKMQPGAFWQDNEPGKVRAALKAAFATPASWGPGQVIEIARHCMPDDAVATVDTGAHRILLSQMWECQSPRSLLQSTGLCTMGCAVPLAAGYKQVAADRPVIAFVGDAGLEMMLGDLATLRTMAAHIIIVVFVDRSLALIELKQRATGRKNLGVDFEGTDFVKIAEGFGLNGAWVDDAEGLTSELQSALKRSDRQTSLLACRFDRKAYDGAF